MVMVLMTIGIQNKISGNPSDPFFFINMEVNIYHRSGKLLERCRGEQQGWDGTYQGKAVPSGNIWYYIILNDIDDRKIPGHFTLYR